VLREDTCTRIVVPAIADLQHEASRGSCWRVRGYVAVWRALAAALVDDSAADTSAAMSAMTAATAMRPALGTAAIVSALFMLPYVWNLDALHGPAWVVLPLLAVSVVPLATLPALTVAARQAARRTQSTRGFVCAAVMVGAFLLLYVDQGVTRTNQLFREVEGQAQGIGNPRPGSREMSLAELRHFDRAVPHAGHQNEFDREGPQRIGFAASAVAYALFGLVLARVTRAWVVAAALIGLTVAHYGLTVAAFQISTVAPGLIRAVTWAPTVVLIATAAFAARRSNRLVAG
jgi:hypothetical protein